jgi:hypothetical protein
VGTGSQWGLDEGHLEGVKNCNDEETRMYVQFVERMRSGHGYRAQLAGPDEREVLTQETLIALKMDVLAVVDQEDTPRVEYLFAAIEAKEHEPCDVCPQTASRP